jgi:ABC-type transporter Mla subunit MlaD
MGLVQDAHAAVAAYREQTDQLVGALNRLALEVAGLAERIAADGPLGASADANLIRAREQLDRARSGLASAASSAAASRTPCQDYVDRALPS